MSPENTLKSSNGCAEAKSVARDLIEKVIILGSGPAGFTAALYAARANLNPLVLEGDGFVDTMPGGQLMITTEIENFPGMVRWDEEGKLHGIPGPEMMEILRRQAQHFGARCIPQRAVAVNFRCRPMCIETEDAKYWSETMIIATGATARWLGIPSEEEYKSYGVSACATCDGSFFKGKDVLVVGGGDTAMEEATYLTRHCRTVTVVHRRSQLRASKIMADRAKANAKIHWIWNAEIAEVLGKTEGMRKLVTGARLRDTKTGDIREIPIDGIFVAIGHKPNTEIFKGQIDMDELGYVRTAGRSTFTTVPGVFACGDCLDHVYRQAITAAGTGCMAAIDAERFIDANPLLYGIEDEVSQPYERIVGKSLQKAEEMPLAQSK